MDHILSVAGLQTAVRSGTGDLSASGSPYQLSRHVLGGHGNVPHGGAHRPPVFPVGISVLVTTFPTASKILFGSFELIADAGLIVCWTTRCSAVYAVLPADCRSTVDANGNLPTVDVW